MTDTAYGVRRAMPAALLAAALLAAGCADTRRPEGSRKTGPPATAASSTSVQPPRPVFPSYAATATVAKVPVHRTPNGPVTKTLANPQASGAPLTFLLAHRSGAWLQVYLPTRPNGSTGWVRVQDVSLAGVPYRLDVLQRAHQLRLYRFGKLVHSYPIAVGKADTPTPGGTFYLKELIRPTNPGGFYGPYAFGLSGFSNALSSFGGGEAVIGLHGTNDESSIGRDVSHGCIRLHNADITALAKLLPLGTPVKILA